MEEQLKYFLIEADLLHLYDHFKEQGIEFNVLLLANDNDLKELVPRIVDKIKLRNALQLHKEGTRNNLNSYMEARLLESPSLLNIQADTESLTASPASTDFEASTLKSLSDSTQHYEESPQPEATCSTNSNTLNTSHKSPNTLKDWAEDEWQFIQEIGPLEEKKPLKEILRSTTFGKSLLKKEGQHLLPRERQALVQLIVEHQLRMLPSISPTLILSS